MFLHQIIGIDIKLVFSTENVTFLHLVDDNNSAFKHGKTGSLYLACTAYSVTRRNTRLVNSSETIKM